MSEGLSVEQQQRKNDKRELTRATNDVARAHFKLTQLQIQWARKYGGDESDEQEEAKKGKKVASSSPKATKKQKKRDAPTEQPAGEEAKEQKKPKEKRADWSCKGNVLTGEPCSVPAAEQTPSSGTKHNGATHDTCVVCKKAITKAKRAEKKGSKGSEEAN